MSKVMKAYKFRLYPNNEQKSTLNQWIGCSRWIWNYMLDFNKKKYGAEKKFVFNFEMQNLIPDLKKQQDTSWLANAPSQVLQQKCQDLGNAIGISCKRKEHGFPKFKSKKTDESGIRFPQGWHIKGKKINLPKLKGIKFKQHREIEGKMTSCTISFSAGNKVGVFNQSGSGVMSFAVGETLDIVSPGSVDSTLADIAFVISSTLV